MRKSIKDVTDKIKRKHEALTCTQIIVDKMVRFKS